MKNIFIILLFISCNGKAAPFVPDKFYVSTTGSPGNSGTLASPWDLQTALNQPGAVGQDDTIFIRGGTYTGLFTSVLTGTSGHPIIVRNYNNERVKIDGTLAGAGDTRISCFQVDGSYTWYWGLEITNSDTNRLGLYSGPTGRGNGIQVGANGGGTGVKIINCITHDMGNGIAAQSNGVDAEIYGCLSFNNGWYATDQSEGTGHGIYAQNQTGTKSFKENIAFNNFGYGLHFYTESGYLNNLYLRGNVDFNDRFFLGGHVPFNNLQVIECYSYKDQAEFGFDTQNNDITLTDNYFGYKCIINYFTTVTATGNTILRYTELNTPLGLSFYGPPDFSAWNFSGNTYYWRNDISSDNFFFAWRNSSIADPDAPGGSGQIYLPAWQDTYGLDTDANFELFADVSDNLVLTGKKIFVRPNAYDANRTHIIIYNWDLSSTVNVDVTGVLTAGDTYELHNVQDYFDDVATGTYTSGNLSVAMTGHTVELPIGYATSWGANTFPEFGTFVLIKTSGTGGSTPSGSHIQTVSNRGQSGVIKTVRDRGQSGVIRLKQSQ